MCKPMPSCVTLERISQGSPAFTEQPSGRREFEPGARDEDGHPDTAAGSP
jgi:hypothetical protein